MTVVFSQKQVDNITSNISGIEFEMNEGTIRSGKTMSDIFKMARLYAASPDRDHLVLAYNQEQAYRMFIDGEGFGLMYIFGANSEIRHNENGDHLWINFPTGEKRIYYKGGGKSNSLGAITGMSFGTVTFLEFNLLHKEVIAECFRRTLASKMRFHLGEQNPPAPNHPNLELIDQFSKTNTYRFRHWLPTDNPILTGKRLEMWKAQASTSDYLYKRDWLGQRVMPEGVIYSMFDTDKHIKKNFQGNVIETFFTADGGQGDATTCAFWVVTFKDGKYYLYRLANYYHSGTDTGVVKAMSTYAREIKIFTEWCYDKWELPHWNSFFVDPACKSLREELHLVGIMTDKADNNSRDKVSSNGMKIEAGIERTQNLLTRGQLLLVDPNNDQYDHYNLIKEIGMYVRTDNGLPVDKSNHACDEMRYGVNYFYRNYIA